MNYLATFNDVADPRLKKLKLPEYRKGHEKLWHECVTEAKGLLQKYKDIRWQVVDLALKCCIIHHGGRVSTNRFTLANFAKEIGLPAKTLNEWVRLKTNILDNIPKEKAEGLSMSKLKYIDTQLKGEKRDKGFGKKVQAALSDMAKKSETTVKMEKYLKHLKTIYFNVKNPRMIKDCDEEVLLEILHVCREIAFGLSKIDKPKKSKPTTKPAEVSK